MRSGRLALLGSGRIVTKGSGAAQMADLAGRAGELVAAYAPDEVALESLFYGRNVSSVIGVAQARGVLLAAAGAAGLECHDFTPQQAKLAVCGSGKASKQDVIEAVSGLVGEVPDGGDHGADAAALAIARILAARAA